MPPRVKVTQEDVLTAALDMVRASGLLSVNARSLAAAIGCSTQPVFSNFPTMECLKEAVVCRATAIYRDRLTQEIQSGHWPTYKAMGMGYICFAAEEPELFKMLFLAPKEKGAPDEEDFLWGVTQVVSNGVADDAAELFHMEMWIFVHGIASMIATGAMLFEEKLISQMISDVYNGLRLRHASSGKEDTI